MKMIKIKQGTRAWESARETRIGSSELFDIIRYYATDDELQNCGFNAELFKKELPFVSTWALYHKILNDGIYQKPLLEPQFAEYGKVMEEYGYKVLKENRELTISRGNVFITPKLIASLDLSGVSEEMDIRPFDFGNGNVRGGLKFVCEQKTISPFKDSLPFKYIIQAQYQIMMSDSDFFILQAMILNEDTPFERGKIVALANSSKKKFIEYLKDKVSVQHIYFDNNIHLNQLIKTCINRFFEAVERREEPTPYIATDTQKNIILSLRNNSFYNPNLEKEYDLSEIIKAKEELAQAEERKDAAIQKVIEFAMANNCSKFYSNNKYTASFSTNGSFLLKPPKEVKND